jgi:hypothetical protein
VRTQPNTTKSSTLLSSHAGPPHYSVAKIKAARLERASKIRWVGGDKRLRVAEASWTTVPRECECRAKGQNEAEIEREKRKENTLMLDANGDDPRREGGLNNVVQLSTVRL